MLLRFFFSAFCLRAFIRYAGDFLRFLDALFLLLSLFFDAYLFSRYALHLRLRHYAVTPGAHMPYADMFMIFSCCQS